MTALASRDMSGWDTRARSPTVTYTYAAYVEKLPVSMHGLGRAQHVAYKCPSCSQQPIRPPSGHSSLDRGESPHAARRQRPRHPGACPKTSTAP